MNAEMRAELAKVKVVVFPKEMRPDYKVLIGLMLLQYCQDEQFNDGFAIGLQQHWRLLDHLIQEGPCHHDVAGTVPHVLLTYYFEYKGDCTAAVRACTEGLVEALGREQHEKELVAAMPIYNASVENFKAAQRLHQMGAELIS